MTWGNFGVIHLSSLLLGAAIIIGLYFALRRASVRVQLTVLGILSFSGIAAIIFNLLAWGAPLEYLPLHLCSLTAMVLPFAVMLRSRVLSNLLLLWSLGALMALVVNSAQADYEIFSLTFVFYFFPHVFEFGIPILLFALGLTKRDPRCILSTLGITFAAYTLIHFVNVWLNSYFLENNVLDRSGNVVQVNYMFSITPENPLLALFRNLIPYDFWYMMPVLPIAGIYLMLVYLPTIIRRRTPPKTRSDQ